MADADKFIAGGLGAIMGVYILEELAKVISNATATGAPLESWAGLLGLVVIGSVFGLVYFAYKKFTAGK